MDSVISTIGSNFSNLKCLSLRLRHFDIDVSTPADFLFDQLEELSLQFVSGNVDLPFQKIISLGWSSIKCLTIQYASLKRESVAAISLYLPQLDKLVLHAVEFRCDHLSKRYSKLSLIYRYYYREWNATYHLLKLKLSNQIQNFSDTLSSTAKAQQ
jgi:hypothetical protein